MIIRVLKKLFKKNDVSIFSKLKKGDIAIDCGANVGEVTQKMSAQGATVYAFEPNPYAFAVLDKKFGANKNVHCINKGVLDRNTRMPIFLHKNSDEDEVYWSQGTSLLEFKGNVNKDKFIEIEVIDLADFIIELNQRIKLLKIDVEGVEYEILEKLILTGVINKIDFVVVETHEKKIPELRAKHEALLRLIDLKEIKNIYLDWF